MQTRKVGDVVVDIVYVVIVYKNIEQAIRLVDRLNGPGAQFLVHVDKKADAVFMDQAHRAFAAYPNCMFIARARVDWGAWGLVQVILNAIHHIVEHRLRCDFLVYMSGQDYPLRSNAAIASFFEQHRGRQFLEYFTLPYENWPGGGRNRFEAYHLQVRGGHVVLPPQGRTRAIGQVLFPPAYRARTLPGGYTVYGGSAAVILARNAVEHVDEFVRTRLGRRMVRFFKLARHADELFFQTVILNSPLRSTVVNDELRYIDWRPYGGPLPKILTVDDTERMVTSGQLFARKFDATCEPAVLDVLDRMIESGEADRFLPDVGRPDLSRPDLSRPDLSGR